MVKILKANETSFLFLPFHAAEQHSKVQINDSAERSDFPKRLHFASSAGTFAESETSDGLPFLVRFCQRTIIADGMGVVNLLNSPVTIVFKVLLMLGKLSVNHQQFSYADNRRQVYMPTKMNVKGQIKV
jgi:hypothetical protein